MVDGKLRQLGDVNYGVMGACAGFAFAIIIVFLAARLSETLIPGTFTIATNVCFWHLADMRVALRDVCFLE